MRYFQCSVYPAYRPINEKIFSYLSLPANNLTSGRSQTTAIAGLCYFPISHKERSCFYNCHSSSSCIKKISLWSICITFQLYYVITKTSTSPSICTAFELYMYVSVAKHALAPRFFFQFTSKVPLWPLVVRNRCADK